MSNNPMLPPLPPDSGRPNNTQSASTPTEKIPPKPPPPGGVHSDPINLHPTYQPLPDHPATADEYNPYPVTPATHIVDGVTGAQPSYSQTHKPIMKRVSTPWALITAILIVLVILMIVVLAVLPLIRNLMENPIEEIGTKAQTSVTDAVKAKPLTSLNQIISESGVTLTLLTHNRWEPYTQPEHITDEYGSAVTGLNLVKVNGENCRVQSTVFNDKKIVTEDLVAQIVQPYTTTTPPVPVPVPTREGTTLTGYLYKNLTINESLGSITTVVFPEDPTMFSILILYCDNPANLEVLNQQQFIPHSPYSILYDVTKLSREKTP